VDRQLATTTHSSVGPVTTGRRKAGLTGKWRIQELEPSSKTDPLWSSRGMATPNAIMPADEGGRPSDAMAPGAATSTFTSVKTLSSRLQESDHGVTARDK